MHSLADKDKDTPKHKGEGAKFRPVTIYALNNATLLK